MKRIRVTIILVVLLVLLSACGNTSGSEDAVNDQTDSSMQSEIGTDGEATEAEEETVKQDEQQADLTSAKPLVYFTSDISASGLVKHRGGNPDEFL